MRPSRENKPASLGIRAELWILIKDKVLQAWGFSSTNQPSISRYLLPVALPMVPLMGIWTFFAPLVNMPTPKTLLSQVITSQLIYQSPVLGTGGADPKCRIFDVSEWQQGQGLLDFENNIWTVADNAPNGLLRFKRPIPLNSVVSLIFTSYSQNQVNLVITAHDLYEVSVGDGDYRGINVKVFNGNDGETEFISDHDGDIKKVFPMTFGEEFTVVLNQGISKLDDGSYELNLRVGQAPAWGTDTSPLFATYNIPLPSKFSSPEASMRLSIGLKAAYDNSQVSAEFLCVNFN